MSKKDEALKLALGKVKAARDCHPNAQDTLLFEAEEILESALAEQPAQQQEPGKVGRITANVKDMVLRQEVMLYTDDYLPIGTAIYTSPPAQPDRVRELKCVIADLQAECQKLRAEQPAQGCDYCNHPQYAGTKCKNCGSEQPAQQERCHLCDCTGDIHSPDGEWRGECPYCKPPTASNNF